MNLTDLLWEQVRRQPEHPALIHSADDETWSYRQLGEKIEETAGRLRDAGVRSGDTVGLHAPSGREYIVLTYALWRCGACVVPIAAELKPDEKRRIAREIRMESLISSSKTLFALRPVLTGTPTPLFGSFVLSPSQKFREHPSGFADLNAAFLRFTSGTTGASKGVILSHETIRERIRAANAILNIGPQDRVVWLLSMSYHFAVSIVSYLSFGATILLCDGPFAADILTTAARHGGTVIYGSPVHYDLMAHVENAPALPNLRLAVSTTTALRGETADAFAARFGRPLVQAYGIIEIGLPCINADRPGDKQTAVGKVLPAYQVRLNDVGAGADRQAIQFRGPGFIDAYYEPFRRREEIMADGWFDTGDLGRLDEEGRLHILGRAKEMISVGGMKFFPQETEEVLAAHPAVAEACVFARADRRLGEIGAARVVLKNGVESPPDERELKDFCALRLAAYKVPESIEFVPDLPRTASGKPLRRDLRADIVNAKGAVR